MQHDADSGLSPAGAPTDTATGAPTGAPTGGGIIRRAGGSEDWAAVRDLLLRAFAFMEGRIDPPSSLGRTGAGDLAAAARRGAAFLAEEGRLMGCVFCEARGEAFYLGKLAVAPEAQGEAIGRALIAAAEAEARGRGLSALELSTRVELLENHAAFRAMGFDVAGEESHPGFDRPTSLIFRKSL